MNPRSAYAVLPAAVAGSTVQAALGPISAAPGRLVRLSAVGGREV